MTRRYLIRDIETKKTNYMMHRKMDFKHFTSAKDFLTWMPFQLGDYYEVYDTDEDEVVFSYEDVLKRRERK